MRIYRTIPPEVRFWPKVRQSGDCWLWTASADKHGYGHFYPTRKQTVAAHRWAYEYLRAEIPADLQLDHLCRTPACVNPWHLEPVPPGVNARRSDSWAGKNSRKTHCPEGHEYAGDNLIINGKGSRVCRTCKLAAWREYDRNRKALLRSANTAYAMTTGA